LGEKDLAKIRAEKIGFVFQTFNLVSSINALKNVALPARFANIKVSTAMERAKYLLEKVGLKHRISHKPNTLSGGERQRVVIARALINNPNIILADEPTGNLDSHTTNEIIDLLEEINKEGTTLFIATHDLEIAKRSKRKIVLEDGYIALD
jgi:putative ABC transport system ATP-binding protein